MCQRQLDNRVISAAPRGSSACAGQGRLLFLTALTGRFERRVRGRGSSRPSAGASPAARYSNRRSWLPSTNVRPPEATARRAAGTALHPSAAAEPAARRTANRTPCSARTAPRRHPRFLGRGGAICSKSILIRLERMVREHRRAGHTSRIEQDSVWLPLAALARGLPPIPQQGGHRRRLDAATRRAEVSAPLPPGWSTATTRVLLRPSPVSPARDSVHSTHGRSGSSANKPSRNSRTVLSTATTARSGARCTPCQS